MSELSPTDWRQIDNVLHRTGAVSDCVGRPGVLEVAKSTYEQLLQSSHDYYKLRQALIAGGVNDEALDTLIRGYRPDTTTATEDIRSRSTENWVSFSNVPFVNKHTDSRGTANLCKSNARGFQMPDPPPNPPIPYEGYAETIPSTKGMDDHKPVPDSESPELYDLKGQHTLMISNLPSNATVKDVTDKIKGGRVIQIRLRQRERKAYVMFAEGASEYLAWVRDNDTYIGAKRIEVSWADHQPRLHKQMSSKLDNGQTRNIILRGAANHVTEEVVRKDLEHIDGLVVSDVATHDRDIVISTNSIHLAGYAKLCLKTRANYRGMNISCYPDECATPLPARRFVPRNMASIQNKPHPPSPLNVSNRFLALELADKSDIASEVETSDDQSDASGIDLKPRSSGTASP